MPERRSHRRFSKQTMMLSWLVLGISLAVPGQVFAAAKPTLVVTAPAVDETITSVPYNVYGTCTQGSGVLDTVTFNDGSGEVDAGGPDNWSYSWSPADAVYPTLTIICCELDLDCKTTLVTNVTVNTSTGSHDLTSFTDNASATLNPDGSTEYLFATVGSTATGGGADVTEWSVTVDDNGTTLAPGDVTVIVKYGGAAAGSASPVTIGTPFSVANGGTENGGSDWTFHLVLAAGADGKDVQLTVTSAAGGNDTTASLPQSSGVATATIPVGCTPVAPTLSFGSGVSIDASAAKQYTLTITNNDAGGCTARDFVIGITNETMTPNDGSFSSSTLTGSCSPSVAESTSNTTCLLNVSSTAGAVDATQLAVTVTDSGGSGQTGSVTTTISLGASLACNACHGDATYNSPPDSADGTRVLVTGAVKGDHEPHAAMGYACTICHIDNGTNSAHYSAKINMDTVSIEGGWYDKNNNASNDGPTDSTFDQVEVPTMGRCDSTNCHGTVSDDWGTDPGGDTCTKCHGVWGQTSPSEAQIAPGGTGVDTAGHNLATDNQVGAHQAHLTAASSFSSPIACNECHLKPATADAADHIDSALPAEMTFGTLAKTGGGTAPAFAGAGGDCTNTYCHGAKMPNGGVTGFDTSPAWTADTYLNGTNFDALCDRCHGFPPKGYTGSHEAMTVGDGSGCSGCHGHLNAGNDANESGWSSGAFSDVTLHINGTVDASGGSCTSCHNGSGPGGKLVSAASPHSQDTTAGGGVFTCENCHTGHTGGNVLIANNSDVGISYQNGVNGYSGDNGINLGSTTVAGATEAEICWNCHNTYGVSEWDTNTQAATGSSPYDYGSLNQLSWVGATWTSGNAPLFNYKTGTIASTHSANTTGATQGVDSKTNIRCSYCHDVHDINLALGDTMTGKPYLRGGWMGNPYKEDGAPQAGTTFASGDFGPVPRATVNTDGSEGGPVMGAYWIDQNSNSPTSTFTTAQNGGLCDLCHGQTKDGLMETADIAGLNYYGAVGDGWVSGVNGHNNSVKGGNALLGGNIFKGRGGTTTLGPNPYQGHDGMTEPGNQGNGDAFYGLRGADYGYALKPLTATGMIKLWDDNIWAVSPSTQADGVTANYHKFSCSKCHNPHASRLPALMITNCLDTKHNTWDNNDTTFPLNSLVGSINENRSLSNWSSAQNCHRLGGIAAPGKHGEDTRADVAAPEAGWNTVTPWD